MSALAVDPRCFDYDHDWDATDSQDEYGNLLPVPEQLQARCLRCGKTLRQATVELIVELQMRRTGRLN